MRKKGESFGNEISGANYAIGRDNGYASSV